MTDKDKDERIGPVMANDPFQEDDASILRDTFYRPVHLTHGDDEAGTDGGTDKKTRPSHYKIVSISLYLDDIDRIDTLVRELKRRGFTKMNRSALIRFAIDTVDIDKLPRQY